MLPYASEHELQRLSELLRPAPNSPEGSLAKYCPHRPWPKQTMFLDLECREAFFGGAAGGGKSDVLLMAALQYVHVPNYHALILRKNFTLLAKSGAIMDRSLVWLHNTDAKWNGDKRRWTFPSGASIEFGYLERPIDWLNYLGTDYQFIGWDELTEFPLSDEDENNPFLCLYRSMRKTVELEEVPLRVRAASNPGGPGHGWVKKRFITDDARQAIRQGANRIFDAANGRKFVPSRVDDNPSLNKAEYIESLMHLPLVTRERQMHGDWDVATDLQIPEEWLKAFTMRGEHLLTPDGKTVDCRQCRRFATIDTAGTSRDKAEEHRGKPPSWSVIAVWDYWRGADMLFLRHVWRERVGWNELKVKAAEVLAVWGKPKAHVENAHVGQPLADELRAAGIQTELVGPVLPGMLDGWRGAKLERAISAGLLVRLEQGRLLIPAEADWRPAYIQELTSWTGNPDETSDQIDASSYGSWSCKSTASSWGGIIR